MAERTLTLTLTLLTAILLTAAPAQADDRVTPLPTMTCEDCTDTTPTREPVPNNPHDWEPTTSTTPPSSTTTEAQGEVLTAATPATPTEAPPTFTG